MSIQINKEYFLNCCYIIPKNALREIIEYVYIYDENGKRFYVSTDLSALIEFNEPVVSDKLPENGILLKRPNLNNLKRIKNSYFELENFPKNLKINEKREFSLPKYNLNLTTYNCKFPNYRNVMPSESNAINYKYDKNVFNIIDEKYIKIFTEKLGIKKENLLRIHKNNGIAGIFYQSENIRVMAMEFANQK